MKTAIFIDGAAMHNAAQSIQKQIDWKPILERQDTGNGIVTRHYFTVQLFDKDGHSVVQKTLDFLNFNGCRITTVDVDEDHPGSINRARGALLTEMVVAMMMSARAGVDRVEIFSGDDALAPVARCLQGLGIKVKVVAVARDLCGVGLRRAADVFTEVKDHEGMLQDRRPSTRVAAAAH